MFSFNYCNTFVNAFNSNYMFINFNCVFNFLYINFEYYIYVIFDNMMKCFNLTIINY